KPWSVTDKWVRSVQRRCPPGGYGPPGGDHSHVLPPASFQLSVLIVAGSRCPLGVVAGPLGPGTGVGAQPVARQQRSAPPVRSSLADLQLRRPGRVGGAEAARLGVVAGRIGNEAHCSQIVTQ